MMLSTRVIGRRLQRSFVTAIPVLLLLFTAMGASAQEAGQVSLAEPNLNAELWRAVREGTAPVVGASQVQGTGTTIPIAEGGPRWRGARQGYLIPWAGWLIAGVLALIVVFHLARKRPAPVGGGNGQIERFAVYDRILHWFQAGVFIFLALTGLILLLGRPVLLPLFGPEAFGAIASASKEGHNLFGPIFLLALVLFFVRFVARSGFARGDLRWVVKGGGLLRGEHLSAGFLNAGQKLWFWTVMLGGLALCVSGLILVFPQFGQSRELMQLMLLVHGIAAVVLVALLLGHVYLGTAGVPGTFRAMNTGKVDTDWMRAHHDRWYRESEEKGLVEKPQA